MPHPEENNKYTTDSEMSKENLGEIPGPAGLYENGEER